MGSFCSGNTQQQQTTNTTNRGTSSGTQGVQGTGTDTSTPFLQWLGTYGANNVNEALAGNPLLTSSAAPVTSADIGRLAYPMAGQEFQAAAGAMQPGIQDQASSIRGSMAANPWGSSDDGALSRYYGTVNANMGNLAQGIMTNAWNSGIPVAESNQAALARAGMGINSAGTGFLGAMPGLISTSGATNQRQYGQQGQSTGSTFNTGTSDMTGQTTYNPSMMSVGAGLLGLGMSPMSPGGQTPFQWLGGLGQGAGSWLGGLFKDGGAVSDGLLAGRVGKADGGPVGGPSADGSFASKVEAAFHTFHKLRKHAETDGGKKPGFEGGGDVGMGSWMPTVTMANPANADTGKNPFLQNLEALNKTLTTPPASPQAGASSTPSASLPTNNPSLDVLGPMMAAALSRNSTLLQGRAASGGRIGYEDGGLAKVGNGDDSDAAPPNAAAPNSSPSSNYQDILKGYGISPFTNALLTIGGNSGIPGVAGFTHGVAEGNMANANLLREREEMLGRTIQGQPTLQAQQLAQTAQIATGQVPINGVMTPTIAAKTYGLEAAKNPTEIEALKAKTDPSLIYTQAVEAENKQFQSRLDQINLMQSVAVPGSPTYRQEMEAASRARDQAMLTHQQNLMRLHTQRTNGVAPPNIDEWKPKAGTP